MGTFLFQDIVFGPVKSRRLGCSLGVNLLPTEQKICNFNCIYCECGWSSSSKGTKKLPDAKTVQAFLERKFIEMKEEKNTPDVITFAGNGEPTLHPDFPIIIEDTILLRNQYFPGTDIAVLSNGSNIDKPEIFHALQRIEKNILKLDAGSEAMCELINKPAKPFNLQDKVSKLQQFEENLIIQSMFLKGTVDGVFFDNSEEDEVNKWLDYIEQIKPASVMIYTIDRVTPHPGLEKISPTRLREIADRVNALGIDTLIAT
jgi:wyosine [tRNA(Phe)-imidazoG37] synthetase (radical SAM superfamily)